MGAYMSKKFRYVMEATLAAIAVMAIVVIIPVVQGYFMSRNYVPDIVKAYDQVDMLQHQVEFGAFSGGSLWFIGGAVFIITFAAYYFLRVWFENKPDR
jgi:quinol-cytochrome oxidoreductase complex cytochrome b subunit